MKFEVLKPIYHYIIRVHWLSVPHPERPTAYRYLYDENWDSAGWDPKHPHKFRVRWGFGRRHQAHRFKSLNEAKKRLKAASIRDLDNTVTVQIRQVQDVYEDGKVVWPLNILQQLAKIADPE